MTVLQTVTCPTCGANVPGIDNYCPECGQATPRVFVSGDQPRPKRRVSTAIVVIGVLVLGAVLVGAAIYGMLRQTSAERQYEASAPVLSATLTDLSGAQSSRMVRDIAADAAARQALIQVTIDQQPTDRGVDRLVVMRDAFAAMAALDSYSVAKTGVWTAVRPGLLNDLATMTSFGGSTRQAMSFGDDAVRTLDDLTARINHAMAEYREDLAAARATAKAKRTTARTYRSRMTAPLTAFVAAQDDLLAYAQQASTKRTHLYDLIDAFESTDIAERALLVQVAQVPAAPGTRAAHAGLLAVLEDEVDLVSSASVDLRDALCKGEGCYFIPDPAWTKLVTELDERASGVDAAARAWRDQVRRAARATAVEKPNKPFM